MTSKSKDLIKVFFTTGSKPTQSQFIDLIDSYVDKSGPLGVLETAVSAGGQGFIYASAADAKIINAATALINLGATVVTTAQSTAVINGLFSTTAAAVAGTDSGSIMTPQLVSQAASPKMVLLATATASTSSSLIFSSTYLTTAYSHFRLVFVDLLSSASSFKQIAFASDNATYTLAAQSTTETITAASSLAISGTAQTNGPVKFTGTVAAAHCGVFDITIGAAVCTMSGTTSDGGNSNDVRTTIMVNGGRVNAIKLTPSSGNFTSGNVYLYGIKNT